jgi:hypothetical protein
MKNRIMTGLLASAGAVLLVAGWPAAALTIGDIDVKSSYGERFSARIPLVLQAGEDISQSCVRLEPVANATATIPTLVNYTLRLEPVQEGKSAVLLATSNALTEPAVRIGLVIRCGQKTSSSREFIVNQKLSNTKK